MKEFLIGDSVELFYGDENDFRYQNHAKGFVRFKRKLEPLGQNVVYYLKSKYMSPLLRVSIGNSYTNNILTSRMVLTEKTLNWDGWKI